MVSVQKSIARILRVNHAGECGAIRIYQAQIALAKILYPDLLPFLRETIVHERRHRDVFAALMRERDVRPCAMLPLWGLGGWMLGALTALTGRNGVMVCTAAVEQVVHQHLTDQIRYLKGREPVIAAAIHEIQAEELQHLNHARHYGQMHHAMSRALFQTIAMLTRLLIWASTYGESGRMALKNDDSVRH